MITIDPTEAKFQLQHCFEINQPVMLWGPTGVGKTEIVQQASAEAGREVISYMLLLRDQVDLRGLGVPDMDAGETTWLRPDDLPFKGSRKFDASKAYTLHLDEINTAPPSLMAVAFQLTLERRAGPHVLQDNVRIVCCGNRQSDRGAAQKMPVPLESRLRHFLLMPSMAAWKKHAAAMGIAPELIAFLLFRERDGFLHEVDKTEPTHATPRTWFNAAKSLDLPAPRRQIAIASVVGEAKAAELEAFLGLYRSLPPIAQIIANPTKAPTPDDVVRSDKERLGLRYAVAVALGKAANRSNLAACLTYAERLPREMAIIMVVDAVNRDKTLMDTKAFLDWALLNQDVTL